MAAIRSGSTSSITLKKHNSKIGNPNAEQNQMNTNEQEDQAEQVNQQQDEPQDPEQ